MQLYGWKALTVCDYHVMFGSYLSSGSGDIMNLICFVISQDHLLKGLCDYMGASHSKSPLC